MEKLLHFFEQNLIVFLELKLHSVEILNGETHQFGVGARHHRELSLQQVLSEEPFVKLHVFLAQGAPNDVNHPKCISYFVIHISCILVLW